jgi:hypothetical protein
MPTRGCQERAQKSQPVFLKVWYCKVAPLWPVLESISSSELALGQLERVQLQTLILEPATGGLEMSVEALLNRYPSAGLSTRSRCATRVARFFLVQNTKKIYQMAATMATGRKVDQMAIKYTNVFHCKTLKKFPKLWFLVLKYTIWQPCVRHQVLKM